MRPLLLSVAPKRMRSASEQKPAMRARGREAIRALPPNARCYELHPLRAS
jgi:hypothetical protein